MKDRQKCSQCDVEIPEDNERYEQYLRRLEFLFPTVAPTNEVNTAGESINPTDDSTTSYIVITPLSGESTTLRYNADQTILDLKVMVEKELKIPCNNQSLLYNDIELKVLDSSI